MCCAKLCKAVQSCAKLCKIKGGAVLAFAFSHVLADSLAVSELARLLALHTAYASQGVAFHKHTVRRLPQMRESECASRRPLSMTTAHPRSRSGRGRQNHSGIQMTNSRPHAQESFETAVAATMAANMGVLNHPIAPSRLSQPSTSASRRRTS